MDSYDHARTDKVMLERAQKYLKLKVGSEVIVDYRSDELVAGVILEVPPTFLDDFLVEIDGDLRNPERIFIDDITCK